jgi:hypothetical protein
LDKLTIQLAQSRFELISLFKHAFAAFFDETVKFDREFGHAPAQVIEGYVD